MNDDNYEITESAQGPVNPARSFLDRYGWVGCLSVLLIPVILCGGVLLVGGGTITAFFPTILPDLFPRPSVQIIPTPTIIESLRTARLETRDMTMTRLRTEVHVNGGVLNMWYHGAAYSMNGVVEAGVSLETLSEEDVQFNESTQTYTLTLPPVALTSCRIDDVVETSQWGNGDAANWDQTRRLAGIVTINQWSAEAINEGILTLAEQDVERVVVNLVTSLGVTEGQTVVVEFDETTTPTHHTSCSPSPPSNLKFCAPQNAWIPSADTCA